MICVQKLIRLLNSLLAYRRWAVGWTVHQLNPNSVFQSPPLGIQPPNQKCPGWGTMLCGKVLIARATVLSFFNLVGTFGILAQAQNGIHKMAAAGDGTS